MEFAGQAKLTASVPGRDGEPLLRQSTLEQSQIGTRGTPCGLGHQRHFQHFPRREHVAPFLGALGLAEIEPERAAA